MTDERQPADPGASLEAMLSSLGWNQAMMAAPLRAQAGIAADALRQLAAPVVDALAWQRELAENLATTAEQLSAMAARLEQLARQHAELTERLQAAMEPYQQYLDRLAELGR